MNSLQFFETAAGPGSHLPLRSTMVTLTSGQKILISPIKFSSTQLDVLKSSSPPVAVAPNLFHHLYIKKAVEDLNINTVFVAPGLEKKRPDIKWPVILGDKTWTYQNELPLHLVEGIPMVNECVFFHKATRTLIVTDLFFNFSGLSASLKTLPFKIFGTYNRPAISRLMLLICKDKSALKRSISRILDWDFDRLVMSHGHIIETGAKNIFKEAAKERGLLD